MAQHTHAHTRTQAHMHTYTLVVYAGTLTKTHEKIVVKYFSFSLLGIYPYMCNLHKGMGMRGYITVLTSKDRINRTPGRIIWGILGGAFLLSFGLLIVHLIVRAVMTPPDE